MFTPPKLTDLASPFDLLHTGTELGLLIWETQSVIALRLMGMTGMWSVTPSENTRMLSEKGPAFQKSAIAAMSAAASGQRPDQVVNAAVKPLRHKTSSNVRRLSKRGPNLPSL